MVNNSSHSIDKSYDKMIIALLVSTISYLLLYYLGRDFTISWQGNKWTIDEAIIWFCSVMPALGVAVALYTTMMHCKLGFCTVFVMVITYIISYIFAFVTMFLMCLILSIFEQLTLGAILIAALPFCGAVQTTVIIIIF